MRFNQLENIRCVLTASCLLCSASALADQNLASAVTSGKFTVNERLRYENVDDITYTREAEALTLRSRIAYETAPFYSFTLLTEGENVTAAIDHYQLPAPPTPALSGYPVVADQENTELNRIQLRYRGVSKLDLILGRQSIIFDNQRWVGNVGFRQDDQTFDAFSAVYKGIDDFILSYAYVSKVNGITDVFDADTSDHLININYSGFTLGKFTLYSYNLKNDEPTLSGAAPKITVNPGLRYATNDTVGLRFDGLYNLPTTVPLRAVYRAEYAKQKAETWDKPGIKSSHDADYKLGELGVVWGFGEGNFALAPMIGFESLGSDNSLYGLQTPYATKHAFNGWADQFLVTPKEGLVDQYVSLGFDWNSKAVKTLFQYHYYKTDKINLKVADKLDLGAEGSLQVIKTFGPQWAIGSKFSVYNQAHDFSDVTNSTKKDLTKAWAWVEYFIL